MRFSLSSATVIVATLLVVDSTSASNVSNGEHHQEASSFEILFLNITNETETGWQEMGKC
jgi:hypothetical protein